MKSEEKSFALAVVCVASFAFVAIGVGMWLFPHYKVYRSRMEGEALLAHSQSAKEVAVSEAKAKMEAAQLLAEAEVTRAEGVAKANKIIGESLSGNEAYLRYLWIQNLESHGNETVIYIPTEAGLPILESSRLMRRSETAESQ